MTFDPDNVSLITVSKEDVLCYLTIFQNDYNGRLGARISSIFVNLFVSAVTVVPVLVKRMSSWKIPVRTCIFSRVTLARVSSLLRLLYTC
jgi:zinc transporter 1/2/3